MKQLSYFLSYFKQAKTIFQVHSPFVYQFVDNVIEDKRTYYAFGQIEDLRRVLLLDNRTVEVTDFGAGSHTMKTNTRKISQIAKYSLSPERQGRALFKIANLYRPKTIVELGTSLGVATLYLHKANQQATIHTLEGCPEIGKIAQRNFNRIGNINIHLHIGAFEKTLPALLQRKPGIDLLYLDGNHRKKPTLDYFEQCLPYLHEQSVVILDDIYWSEEMYEAWQAIKAHPDVTLTIDNYDYALVYFRKAQKEKEHYSIISRNWKFWRFM